MGLCNICLTGSKRDDMEKLGSTEKGLEHENQTFLQKFGMLSRFMIPLVVTQMVPDISEQVINRGITSIASEDMVNLLASYGLAFYFLRFLQSNATELKHIGIVLVKSKADNIRITIFTVFIGLILTGIQLLIGLTVIGTWLIRDVHRQSEDVSETTCQILIYLSPSLLLDSIANYYEGALISKKFTLYAGIAKLADFGLQASFVAVLLFTSTRTEPVFVPVFSFYAGIIGRLILDVGFWYVLVRRQLPKESEKPLRVAKAAWFWLPIALVRSAQMVAYPVINLAVSRYLVATADEETAAKAVAVLTASYPISRITYSWLSDLRTVAPTFRVKTEHHEKFSMKVLTIYSFLCTAASVISSVILFVTPGVAFFIMNTIIGLNEELSTLSLLPLQISIVIALCVGVRAHFSGILIMQKKTVYLTPGAILRVGAIVLFVSVLPQTGLSGPVLGMTTISLGFLVETLFAVIAAVISKFQSRLCARKEVPMEKISDEEDKYDYITEL